MSILKIMNQILKVLLFVITSVCTISVFGLNNKAQFENDNYINYPKFQKAIDDAKLDGSVLIYDSKNDKYYSNDFELANEEKLPASTFKITNSIIGLETGVVKDAGVIFKWDGEKRALKVWEQDLTLRGAFMHSCVPCYQEVARKIGVKRMNEYLTKLNYGNMVVDSSNIDVFWLQGDSKISQFQQIDFLKRFYNLELPISEQTTKTMKKLMLIKETSDYKIFGKTGWSIRDGNNHGWFVGYIETEDNVWFFATKITPTDEFDMTKFPKMRIEITYEALKILEVIK